MAIQNADSVAITGGTLTDVIVSTGLYSSRVNETLMKKVRKASAGTINKGQVVYITGSTGNHLTVELADASTEAESSPTIAIAAETITDLSDSYALVAGQLTGLNTLPTASFTNGSALWLSTTPGQWTTTRPTAPDHGTFLGWVVNASNGNSGIAYIKIINYNELDELHNVLITSATNNDVLMYDSGLKVWKNQPVGTASTPYITRYDTATASAGPYITWQRLPTRNVASDSASATIIFTTTSVGAGTWQFDYHIVYQSAATTTGTGMYVNHTGASPGAFVTMSRFLTTGGAAATGVVDQVQSGQTTGLVEGKGERVLNTVSSQTVGVDTQSANVYTVYSGLLVVNNTGDLQFKVTSEVNGSNIFIEVGSFLELKKIA